MKKEDKEILPNITNIKTQETFTLPSKGLIYDPTSNIKESITLRRMTTKEDKIRMRNSSEDKIRNDILQACILDDHINAGDLKLVDANFLLFRLRSISLLDDTYKIQCFCPNCTTTFIHEINLSEVPIKYMTKTKLKDLEIILPFSKQKISLKYPSIKDMIAMGEKLKSYFDQFPNADKSEVIFSMSSLLYIKLINETALLSEELEDWLENLDIIDSRYLRKAVANLDKSFGFDEDLKAICPKCGKELSHGLPITGELFNPSL